MKEREWYLHIIHDRKMHYQKGLTIAKCFQKSYLICIYYNIALAVFNTLSYLPFYLHWIVMSAGVNVIHICTM